MTLTPDSFINKVKQKQVSELRTKRKPYVKRSWKSDVFKLLGWLTVVLGFLLLLSFFIVMESVHTELSGVINSQLGETLQDSEKMNDVLKKIGIDWFPVFMKIYKIRFAIILGAGMIFSCIAFVFFYFSKKKKEK